MLPYRVSCRNAIQSDLEGVLAMSEMYSVGDVVCLKKDKRKKATIAKILPNCVKLEKPIDIGNGKLYSYFHVDDIALHKKKGGG